MILADENFALGGRCLAERRTIDGQPAAEWAAQAIAELRSMPDVRLFPRTTVFGVFDDGVYGAVERVNDHLPVPPEFQPRQRVWRFIAKQTVLASGSIERPLVFGNNDLPGVMLAGAVRTYVNRYAVLPGRRESCLPTTTTAGPPQRTSSQPAGRSPQSSIRASQS